MKKWELAVTQDFQDRINRELIKIMIRLKKHIIMIMILLIKIKRDKRVQIFQIKINHF